MRYTSVFALALALVGLIVVLWIASERDVPDTAAATAGFTETAIAADPEEGRDRSAEVAGNETVGVGQEPSAARRHVASSVLAIRISDSQGNAIADASCSWSPLRDEFDGWYWSAQDWKTIDELTISGVSDARGRLALKLPVSSSGLEPSVFWATHPDHEAGHQFLLDGNVPLQELDLRLPPGRQMRVRVVDGAGLEVQGARIDQFGRATGQEADPWYRSARRVFHRVFASDQDGMAVVPELPGRFALRASKEPLLSAPYLGEHEEEIELVLLSQVFFEGVVRSDVPIREDVHVGVAYYLDDDGRGLGALEVGTDGRFGPGAFPLVDADFYELRLTGGGFIPDLVEVPPPRPGTTVDVELQGVLGDGIHVQVVDEQDEPVPRAVVWAEWEGDPWYTSPRPADEEGRFVLTVIPERRISVGAEAEGFSREIFGPYLHPQDTKDELVLTLRRAGVLEGEVLNHGEPVPSFEIVWWGDNYYDDTTESFTEAEDGRFALDTVPVGSVTLYAFSDSHPRSEPATVDLADGPGFVSLELPDPVQGRGQVVDGVTGDPLPQAELQIYSSFGRSLITKWGDPIDLDQEGRFMTTGFAPGDAFLLADAPGYELDIIHGYGVPGQLLDFGAIPLYPAKTLTVRLVADTETNFSSYILSSRGIRHLEPTPFSADGVIVFEECAAGTYFFTLRHPDGSNSYFSRFFHIGEEWEVTHRVETGRALGVVLTEGGATKELDSGWVSLSYRPRSGRPVERQVQFDDGEDLVVTGLDTDVVALKVYADDDWIGSAVYEFTGSGPYVAHVPIDSGTRRFRIIDAHGSPVGGCRTWVMCSTPPDTWAAHGTTEPNGFLTIPAPPCDDLTLNLEHVTLGRQYGTKARSPSDEDDVETVVMDTPASVAVRLLDGSKPVTGVKAWLLSKPAGSNLGGQTPDRDGIAEWRDLPEMEFGVVCGAPGYWTATASVVATRKRSEVVDLQLRKTGSIDFLVRDAEGEPAAYLAIGLVCLDLGMGVEAWISSGILELPGGLVTDSEGRLVVHDVPNGTYEWQIELSDGGKRRGRVSVPGGGLATEEISLF